MSENFSQYLVKHQNGGRMVITIEDFMDTEQIIEALMAASELAGEKNCKEKGLSIQGPWTKKEISVFPL